MIKIKDKLKLIVDNEEVYFSVDFILEQLHEQNLMNKNNLEVINTKDEVCKVINKTREFRELFGEIIDEYETHILKEEDAENLRENFEKIDGVISELLKLYKDIYGIVINGSSLEFINKNYFLEKDLKKKNEDIKEVVDILIENIGNGICEGCTNTKYKCKSHKIEEEKCEGNFVLMEIKNKLYKKYGVE